MNRNDSTDGMWLQACELIERAERMQTSLMLVSVEDRLTPPATATASLDT